MGSDGGKQIAVILAKYS